MKCSDSEMAEWFWWFAVVLRKAKFGLSNSPSGITTGRAKKLESNKNVTLGNFALTLLWLHFKSIVTSTQWPWNTMGDMSYWERRSSPTSCGTHGKIQQCHHFPLMSLEERCELKLCRKFGRLSTLGLVNRGPGLIELGWGLGPREYTRSWLLWPP